MEIGSVAAGTRSGRDVVYRKRLVRVPSRASALGVGCPLNVLICVLSKIGYTAQNCAFFRQQSVTLSIDGNFKDIVDKIMPTRYLTHRGLYYKHIHIVGEPLTLTLLDEFCLWIGIKTCAGALTVFLVNTAKVPAVPVFLSMQYQPNQMCGTRLVDLQMPHS